MDVISRMTAGDEYGDPENRGLRVRCLKSNAKVFFYRYRDKAGALRQIKIGVLGAEKTLPAIRADFARLKAVVRNGGDPQAEKRQLREDAVVARRLARGRRAKAKMTCAHLVESYLREIVARDRKPKGAREARRMLERAIRGHESQAADELTRFDAHEIIMAIAATAPRVAQMTRAELRACWDHSISVGRVFDNPFSGRAIGAIPKPAVRQRVLGPDEVGLLLRWMREPGAYSRTVSDALELTLRTGLRSGDVVAIHTRELLLRDGVLWLEIPRERMKTGQAHSAPLIGRAFEIACDRWPQATGFLFPARSGDRPIEQKVLGVEVYAASGRSQAPAYARRRICPVSNFAPHDLHRTTRTLLTELGCPFEIGEAILAHARPGGVGDCNQVRLLPQRVEWLTRLGEYLDTLSVVCGARSLPLAPHAPPGQ